MPCRLRVLFAIVVLALPAIAQEAAPAAPASPEQPSSPLAIIVESMKRANNDLDLRKNYTYQEREVEKELDGNGNVKKTEIHTYDVVLVGGKHHRKLIAKDDQPLTEKEAAKEEERVRKQQEKEEKHDQASDEDKAKRKHKDEEQERKFIQVMSEVYDFSFAGEQVVDSEPAWIIRAVPRPNYQPHSVEARLLKCLQGDIWITKNDYRWIKIDAQAINDFSYGLFLLKLHKGMHIHMEQTRINNEVWLPKLIRGNMDARIAWHTARMDFETTYSNYQKFRADAKVMGVIGQQ